MAETKSEEEPATTKRKPDSATADDCSNKSLKLESSAVASEPKEVAPSVVDDDEEDGDYGSQDEDDDAEDQKSNGDAALADRKGKSILRDDKGKGKMIFDDDDQDSSDGGSDFEDDVDSELSDDPLAEVDLNNILPSRTRRRQVQPGLYIANDHPNADDDSDDDSDA